MRRWREKYGKQQSIRRGDERIEKLEVGEEGEYRETEGAVGGGNRETEGGGDRI